LPFTARFSGKYLPVHPIGTSHKIALFLPITTSLTAVFVPQKVITDLFHLLPSRFVWLDLIRQVAICHRMNSFGQLVQGFPEILKNAHATTEV
jgi:hypothetical protein